MTAPRPPYAPAPYPADGPHQPCPYPPHGPYPYPPYGVRPVRPWYVRPWAVALAVFVAIGVLGGTAVVASAAAGRSTGAQGGGDGSLSVPTGTGTGPGTGETHCPGGSLEDCFDESGMQDFLGVAVRFVQGFSDDRYSRMPHPAGYALVGTGQHDRSPCGEVDGMSYSYCPADDRIYIGQKQLWQFYSQIGDAAAVVGLAHEYGHHVQRVAGVPDDRSPSEQVRHENQADCIAGAFVGWAQEKGYLEDGDTQDVEGLVEAIASSEDDPDRDHGTLQERAASLSTGIRQGLAGCSTFYPQTPVHESA